ncbi:hypothetical protein LJR231_002254 [Phyllobacterium sp. LjRoot231]|uniref:hypothetical protein n=1 Tax=Phyllobacterium sp. LjRoot231 TaxID=3342289 RepID=UPI003ECED039
MARMDILEIDAASFAGRVAHVAASELHGLVSWGKTGGIINWYDRGGSELPPEQINLDIDAAADYVTTKHCSGEQLWHKMLLEKRASPTKPHQIAFTDLPFSVQLAYNIFAQVCDMAHARIQTEQNRAENELELATRPDVPLKLEDSIFEPEEHMGTLRPEAVIASGLDAVRRDLEERDALLLQAEADVAAITGLDNLNGQEPDTGISSAGAPDPAGEGDAGGPAAGEDGGSVGDPAPGAGEGSEAPGAPSAEADAVAADASADAAAPAPVAPEQNTPDAEPVGGSPLAIGSAPPAPKPNRGGRGKKKQK